MYLDQFESKNNQTEIIKHLVIAYTNYIKLQPRLEAQEIQ